MEKIDIANQIKYLNELTKAYDNGSPLVSDEEWDNEYFKLVKMENESGIYLSNSPTQSINYQVVSELTKVKHNHPMLSLDKTKDWDEFLNYFKNLDNSKDVVGMLKLDGLTCSLKYVDGKLVSAETRGDGVEGEDVLHNAKVIKNIPNRISYKDELVVDGEIICTYKNFNEFSDEYKNPRNFAAGSIRLLDAKECANRNLTFVVWNVVTPITNSVINNFNIVKELGFTVTPFTSTLLSDTQEFLKSQAKVYGYPIDGLVGRFDDVEYGNNLGATSHHAKSALAFKFYDEEYDTKLVDIEFSLGRTGLLTPVAIYEPIDTGDSILTRASLHNLSVMNSILGTNPYIGQNIKVAKMNEIIPQITWADNQDPKEEVKYIHSTTCPVCGCKSEIKNNDNILTIWCSNPNCEGKLVNQLDHYCGKKGMDIKGLSKSTLDKLVEWGWVNNIIDIYNLTSYAQEWMNKSGFGEKSVTKILNAIENSKKCELWQFISAIGISGVGTNTAKILAQYFKSWKIFRQVIDGNTSLNTILSIDGFGYCLYENLIHFNYSKMADKIYPLLNIKTIENKPTNDSLKDIVVVITGKLTQFKNRDALKAEIEARGGKVANSISGKTKYLINNDSTSTTAKNKKAKELNIPILTEQEFTEKFF